MTMLAVVVNHQHTSATRRLVEGLRPHVPTCALDSGSSLTPEEMPLFQRCLPNVYYSGLLNAAHAELRAQGRDVLYFICSDMDVPCAPEAVAAARQAFGDRRVGVYAPAVRGSGHPHMANRGDAGWRPVSFVEGGCFAVRASLLQQLCPIDTRVNALGWGLDVYLGYLAWRAGLLCVVDDRITVHHAGRCGYSIAQARAQRDAWFARLAPQARRFRWLTGLQPAKTPLGWQVARRLLAWSG